MNRLLWTRRLFVGLAIAGLCAQGACVGAGEKYAFLVSVKDYDEKELRPLQFTHHDLDEFRKSLSSSGFREDRIVWMHDDVSRLENRKYLPEAEKIRHQFRLLLAGLEPGDTVVVALAGHGVQFRDEPHNYFCPVDTRLSDRRTLISLQELYGELKECRASRKLLLVDACRNDPQSALSRSRASVDLESVTRPQREAAPEGLVALFSCGPGQQSYEHPPLQHGIFFHHVLKGWNGDADADRDGALTFEELSGFVRRETASYARRQLDVLQTPHLKSDTTGDWVLRSIPRSVDTASEPNPPSSAKRPSADREFFSRQKPTPGDDLKRRVDDAAAAVAVREKLLAEGFDLYNQNLIGKEEIVRREEAVQEARAAHQAALTAFENGLKAGEAAITPRIAGTPSAKATGPAAASRRLSRPAELQAFDADLGKARLELQDAERTHARLVLIYSQGKSSKLDVIRAEERVQRARDSMGELEQRIRVVEEKLGVSTAR